LDEQSMSFSDGSSFPRKSLRKRSKKSCGTLALILATYSLRLEGRDVKPGQPPKQGKLSP
jgi:hypothetical protein